MGVKITEIAHRPSTWFGAYLLVATIANFATVQGDGTTAESLARLESLTLGFIAAVSVTRSARKNQQYWPSDHMFLLWWMLFPIYLLSEQKWRGLLILIGLTALIFISIIGPELLR